AVAASVKVPIMLYNIPGRCGIEVSVETIKRLRESCDNLTSVKHATGKVEGVSQVLAACNIDVLSGDDPLTLPMMSAGAIGVVSVLSNLAPRTVKKMTDAGLKGDWKAAREAHHALWPFASVLLGMDTNPIPVKTAMSIRGFCKEEFRLPIVPLASGEREALAKLLRENELR
ncbi:MAG: dihydrodipicolinate synthase family protein, partial [Phycisphaerae bacterium]